MKKLIFLLLIIFSTNFLSAQSRVFPFKENNKWGIIDENQKIIKEASFDYITFFINHDLENAHSYASQNSRWGLIDRNGEIIIPFEYDHVLLRNTAKTARLRLDGKVGTFDLKNRKVCIPIIYRNVTALKNEKYFRVIEENKKCGIADINHKIIIPIEYSFVEDEIQEDGSIIFKAMQDSLIILFDESGNVLKNTNKEEKIDEENGPYFMDMDIDEDEDFVPVPPIKLDSSKIGSEIKLYQTIKNEKNGARIGIVRTARFYGIIDEKSNLLAPIEYEKIKLDYDLPGLLLLGQDRLYGWFSMDQNKIILPAEYQKIELATRYYSRNNRDKKVDNYFFLTTSEKDSGVFFDITTGQIFSPKK
jgi:hypothetical protein